MTSAISGTRRAMKEMADGTIRVQIDIDGQCRAQFLELFPNIDMPVALAPLIAEFERQQPAKPKGGALAELAGMWCNTPDFQEFVEMQDADEAAGYVRETCGIDSRAELDHNEDAAALFQEKIRLPYMAWLRGRGAD